MNERSRENIYANLVGWNFKNNEIFDLSHSRNRDNCLYPYRLLREEFSKYAIILNTPDLNYGKDVSFEVHLDPQEIRIKSASYLLLLEPPQVRPENASFEALTGYEKIFTWNDNASNSKRSVKINFPNEIKVNQVNGFRGRDIFCCVIAGNKVLKTPDVRDLYSERVKTIRWFENNAPNEFSLFGTGWDYPSAKRGMVYRAWRQIYRCISKPLRLNPFPSYKGVVENKGDVLLHTRFNICYENVRDIPGYITEKIFDSFSAGCVPVYWGASNVTDYIPRTCFIDRRQFNSVDDLFEHLKGINEETYCAYQTEILRFLKSDAAAQFGASVFAKKIVDSVVFDLKERGVL